MNSVLEFIKGMFGSKSQRLMMLIIIILLLFMGGCGSYFYNKMRNMEVDAKIASQNEYALTDSLRKSKNKANEIEYSKGILIADKKNLSKLNEDLANQLKKESGKVHELNKYVIVLKGIKDTTIINNTLIKYGNGIYGLEWKYDTTFNSKNSRTLAGISEFKLDSNYRIYPLTTKITKDITQIKLYTGLRENKDKQIEIFATSEYPGFEVLEMDGAIIDPKTHPLLKQFTKKKKVNVGASLGYGICFSNGQVYYGPIGGVTIGYSLFSF